jgi:hypothetical protein
MSEEANFRREYEARREGTSEEERSEDGRGSGRTTTAGCTAAPSPSC